MNDEKTFEVFSFFQLSAIALQNSRQYLLDYVAFVYVYLQRFSSLKRRYTVYQREDVIFQLQMTSSSTHCELLFDILHFFSIDSKGEVRKSMVMLVWIW